MAFRSVPTHLGGITIWNPWSNKTNANLEDSACTECCYSSQFITIWAQIEILLWKPVFHQLSEFNLFHLSNEKNEIRTWDQLSLKITLVKSRVSLLPFLTWKWWCKVVLLIFFQVLWIPWELLYFANPLSLSKTLCIPNTNFEYLEPGPGFLFSEGHEKSHSCSADEPWDSINYSKVKGLCSHQE